MYGVLGALQSPRFPFEFSANGRYVNMGSFSEMVFRHDKSLPMGISFSLDEDGYEMVVDTTWVNGDVNDQGVLSRYPNAQANYADYLISQLYHTVHQERTDTGRTQGFLRNLYA